MLIGCTHIRLQDNVAKERDGVIKTSKTQGIETRPVFYPLHVLPPYRQDGQGPFPRAELCGARGINLPTHGRLTDQDMDRVTSVLEASLA